jgi:hypothetical protein
MQQHQRSDVKSITDTKDVSKTINCLMVNTKLRELYDQMKNLTAHKHIVTQHRARNRCNDAMFAELRRRIQPILAASQERWDGMIAELQRCNSKATEKRFNTLYPMLNYENTCAVHTKAHVDAIVNDFFANTKNYLRLAYIANFNH